MHIRHIKKVVYFLFLHFSNSALCTPIDKIFQFTDLGTYETVSNEDKDVRLISGKATLCIDESISVVRVGGEKSGLTLFRSKDKGGKGLQCKELQFNEIYFEKNLEKAVFFIRLRDNKGYSGFYCVSAFAKSQHYKTHLVGSLCPESPIFEDKSEVTFLKPLNSWSAVVERFKQFQEVFSHSNPKFFSYSGVDIVLFMLLCFFLGIVTNLSPCVWPLLPTTIGILKRFSEKKSKEKNSSTFKTCLMYTMGLALSYGLLGVLSGFTGENLSTYFQTPLALTLFGFFNLFLALSFKYNIFYKVPILANKVFSKNLDTPLQPFILGVGASFFSAPCSAPIVLALVSWMSLGFSTFYAVIFMFIYSIGFAIPHFGLGALANLRISINKFQVTKYFTSGVTFILFLVSFYYFFEAYKLIKTPLVSEMHDDFWESNIQKALLRSQKENKKLLVKNTASWCYSCQISEKEIWSKVDKVEFKKIYVPIKVDYSIRERIPKDSSIFRNGNIPALLVFDIWNGETLGEPLFISSGNKKEEVNLLLNKDNS